MSRRAASVSIVLFLVGGFVRFKAFGLDPPLPVPHRLANIVESSPLPDRFSTGLIPLRLALMMPMTLAPWFLRDRGWLRLLRRSPLRWYSLFFVWAAVTLPFTLSPRDVAISTVMLASISAFVVWSIDEFGWMWLVRVLTGTIGVVSVLSLIWASVVPDEAFHEGRLTGIALVPTHLGEACGAMVVLLVVYRGRLFKPHIAMTFALSGAVCVVWTQTRGALGALAIAAVWLALRPGRVVSVVAIAGLLLVTPILLFSPVLDSPVSALARDGDEIGLSGRARLWQLVVDDADDLVLTGTGYGLTFGGQSDFLSQKTSAGETPVPLTYLHNLLVGAFAIYGAVGVFLVVMVFLRCASPPGDPLGLERSTLLAYLAAIGISEAVLLEAPIRMSTMLIVGLLTSVALEAGRPESPPRAFVTSRNV